MNASDLSTTASWLVIAAAAVGLVLITSRSESAPRRPWITLSLLGVFGAWTTYAVVRDGLFGFWTEHVGTPWETQIFMDLVLGIGTAWFLLQPRLRARGINPWPWMVFTLATGSIGLLATLSRLLWVEAEEAEEASPA